MNTTKIALFYHGTDTMTNPTLVGFFKSCQTANIRILFFAPAQVFPIKFDNIEHYCFSPPLTMGALWTRNLPLFVLNVFNSFKGFIGINKILSRQNIDIFIGINPTGIFSAWSFYKRYKGKKLGYFSFELIFTEEIKRIYSRNIKKLEVKSSKDVSFLLIQDKVRERLLREECQLKKEVSIFLIPVSPIRIESRLDNRQENKNSLRKQKFLPLNKILYVYSGSVAKWAGIQKILDFFATVKDSEMVLIIHSRFKLRKNNIFRQKIEQLKKDGVQILLHDTPFLDEETYYDFLQSCDVGIVSYAPFVEDAPYLGKNIQEIGLASGKFSTYAMLGLPILSLGDVQVYKELNDEYDYGEICNSKENFYNDLSNLKLNILKKCAGTKLMYEEVLDAQYEIEKLIKYINK